MSLQSINPATGELIRTYPEMTLEEVDNILQEVQREFLAWRTVPFSERAKYMHRAAELLRTKKGELARLMAEEMGKPVRQGEAEAEKCAWVCDYYAENAASFLAPEIVATDAHKSYVAYQPLGIVLAVMPWNFPFWQVFRFAAPALMAGNAGVLKHASNVSGCALAIESILREAGFPRSIFRTLLVGSSKVAKIIEHPLIRAVTLTGSTPAGRAVAAKAGQMLKKTVLELGGSDPYIVLEDADLGQAVTTCATSRLINGGQSCIAAKRFIVVPSILKAFEEQLVEQMRAVKIGDPFDPETDLGPMARVDLRDELHQQVVRSLEKGAKLLLGGEIPPGPGAYYPPTVLTNVNKGQAAYHEELFGPVAAIIPVTDDQESITVANDSEFGLGAAVFTQNVQRGEKLAVEEVEAGAVFVNTFVRSDPRLPFGGVKGSGYGRELARFGIREFVNIKTIFIA